MAGFREKQKHHFPLQSVKDVVSLFRDEITGKGEPNLTLLSIVLGYIENILTVHRALPSETDTSNVLLEPIFPIVQLDVVEALYEKFVSLVKKAVDLTKYSGKHACRDLVKLVSDVIWGSLTRSFYKDRAHLQSLYSLLTGNKLDCFGVAFGVVAAFQVLGYDDVHLALSEDHAWVVFGEDLSETAEVTWHGKGNEDKRGQPISVGVCEKSWLYLNGNPVICDRNMEVTSIVSGINPSINATVDSLEMGSLQQELLWLLYDLNHLEKYPMALGNLGDLEEISRTPGRQAPIDLFNEAINSSKKFYSNQHVYPYTYLGGYLYRKGDFRGALQAWAQAANAVKCYNYNREDEEIYKEFLEIANHHIPTMMKQAASENAARIHHTSILYDPECYANFLRFYDGICEWEEGSQNPVLHITWAKQLVFSLSKFDISVREKLNLKSEGIEEESSSEEDEDGDDKSEVIDRDSSGEREDKHQVLCLKGRRGRKRKVPKLNNNNCEEKADQNGSNKSEEDNYKLTIEELAMKVGDTNQTDIPNAKIAELAQQCGDSILNPEYLLSGGEPFSVTSGTTTAVDPNLDVREFLSSKSNGSPFMGMTIDSVLKAESPSDMVMFRKGSTCTRTPTPVVESEKLNTTQPNSVGSGEGSESCIIPSPTPSNGPPLILCLHSAKLAGLKKIFSSDKLNASAIQLQLTAQSQVHFKHGKRSTDSELPNHRKRSRRE